MEPLNKSPTESTTLSVNSSLESGIAYGVVPLVIECPTCGSEAFAFRRTKPDGNGHLNIINGAVLIDSESGSPIAQCHNCLGRYRIPKLLL